RDRFGQVAVNVGVGVGRGVGGSARLLRGGGRQGEDRQHGGIDQGTLHRTFLVMTAIRAARVMLVVDTGPPGPPPVRSAKDAVPLPGPRFVTGLRSGQNVMLQLLMSPV